MNNKIITKKDHFWELPKIKQVHKKWASRSGVVVPDRPAFHAGEACNTWIQSLAVTLGIRNFSVKFSDTLLLLHIKHSMSVVTQVN